jgi:hypothetical protein
LRSSSVTALFPNPPLLPALRPVHPRLHLHLLHAADDQARDIAHEMKDLDAKQTMLQGIMFVLQ